MPTLLLALLGCGPTSDEALDPGTPECEPVADSHCLLPFPSSYFLATDPDTPTGFRVSFQEASLPVNIDDAGVTPGWWNEKDGFSTSGPLIAHFPGVDVSGLVGHQDLDAYLDADVATVILDAETGARVPHFVELEVASNDPERQALLIRPMVPLEHATRYVVGIRRLVDSGGAALPAAEGFRVLRDGEDADTQPLEDRREHYESLIFPALEEAGFARSELQLAWDFVTVSAENSLGRMLQVRDDAIERLGDAGPAFVVDEVSEADCGSGATIGRTVTGTLSAPLYLEDWAPGSVLTRDEGGMPSYNGQADVPFTVRVPCSLIEGQRPGAVVQVGHGVLGSQDEVYGGWLGTMADQYGWVLVAVDWTGMKSDDIGDITLALITSPGDFVMIPDRLHQGFVEFLAAERMVAGELAQHEALMSGGVSLVDPERRYFYGISQGSILGGGYATWNPDISRAALEVGGAPFSLILTRSWNFDPFLAILDAQYDDWMDISLLMGLFQQLWDPAESGGWANFMQGESVDGVTPPTTYLLQTGIGDTSVSTLAGQYLARAFGASLVTPAVRPVWGLEELEAPFEGSALVEYDYGYEEPVEATHIEETDAHGRAPSEPTGMAQVGTFFEEGLITHTCDGPCDPD
jgi:hypothetical protein